MSHTYIKKPDPIRFDLENPGFRTLISFLLCITVCGGCMRRRITVRTNPPGALLYVDNQEVGLTPVSFYVNYYGTRDIRLVKDGFKTVVEQHTFNTPWYQIPPFDLISDNFLFSERRDERFLHFALEAMPNVDNLHLRDRANNLRLRAQQGLIIPLLPSDPSQPPVRSNLLPVGVPGDGLQ